MDEATEFLLMIAIASFMHRNCTWGSTADEVMKLTNKKLDELHACLLNPL